MARLFSNDEEKGARMQQMSDFTATAIIGTRPTKTSLKPNS